MSLRLHLPLKLFAVALAGLLAWAALGPRSAALLCLAALAGLLLGRLGAREDQPGADKAHAADGAPRVPTHVEHDTEVVNGTARARALLEATMNGMREGVLVVDSALRVVAANSAAHAIFAHTVSPEAGVSLIALTRNPEVHAAYRAALERGEDNQVKVELLAAERRVLELRVAPLWLDEAQATRGAIGVFFDITRLEHLERVRQEFLSNVSHELRTPLTSIITSVETLEDGALEDAAHGRRFLSAIGRNAARMRTLIEDIQELSSIESGGMPVDARQVRLHPLVQETFNALAAKAETRGVRLVNQVAPEALVRADPRRLEQILLNLADNAIKFSRTGGSVTVGHERCERDLVNVSDTGEGIAPEHLPRIFERFYRVDRARSREMGGTGLGLAIVKHLARAHGGEVRVRSTPDEGSTFTVELPREHQADTDTV